MAQACQCTAVLSRRSPGCPCSQAAVQQVSRAHCSPQQLKGSHCFTHGAHTANLPLYPPPRHLTEPSQCSLAPEAHPPANFCPCKPCRVCPSAQHLSSGARAPHLRDHSQCLPSDSSQPNPGSVSRQGKILQVQQCTALSGLCSPLDETTQTQADCDSSLSCAISAVVDCSREKGCA